MGLIPSWSKDGKMGSINARAESIATNGMFRAAFEKRRCLVPVDVFYEWRTRGKAKQPFAFGARDGDLLALAGIWEGWKQPDGNWLHTYSLITTEPNETMKPIHTRMPVIVDEADWEAWLDGSAGTDLLRPAPDDLLMAWPVSTAVSKVANDGPELLEAIREPEEIQEPVQAPFSLT